MMRRAKLFAIRPDDQEGTVRKRLAIYHDQD